MFKLYRKSQQAQYRWVRKHPFQWLALNGVLLAVFIGLVSWWDRKQMRELENEIAQQS